MRARVCDFILKYIAKSHEQIVLIIRAVEMSTLIRRNLNRQQAHIALCIENFITCTLTSIVQA